jgi:hypothetical protein
VDLAAGTLSDGSVGEVWSITLGVGSSTLGVGDCCDAMLSKIAANSFIACILSDPSCLNGIVGAG